MRYSLRSSVSMSRSYDASGPSGGAMNFDSPRDHSTVSTLARSPNRLRAAGKRMAVLTNKPVGISRAIVDGLGVGGHFFQVYGGNSFDLKKPDPIGVAALMRETGIPAGRTLMIGDSQNDAQAARAAGCPVVLVTYGYNHGQPVRAVDADGFLDSLDALFDRAG